MALKDFPESIQESVENKIPPRLRNTYLAAFAALLYIIVLGMAVSYPAPATVDMKKFGSRFMDITQDEITWIASLPVITGSIGTLVSAYITNKLGRKTALLLISPPYVLSWLMVAYAPTIAWIYCGRLITGFCFGFSAVSVPAYVVEIAPVKIRGLFATGFQVFYSFGVLIMMLLGYGLRWSWLAMSGAVTVTLASCLMFFMPESPAWLLRESRKLEAIQGLKFLVGDNVDHEKELQGAVDNLNEETPISFRHILNPGLYKPIMIGVGLCFFQQFAGINGLTAYTVEIFENIGSPIDAQSSAVIFAVVQVLISLLSSVFMDRVGRRALYVTSGILTFLAMGALGVYCIFPRYGYNMSGLEWIPLTCVMIYIGVFDIGYGPVPMVMAPELVPIQSRSTLLAICVLATSAFSFIVTKTFDILVSNIGYYGLYWTYGTFALMGSLFGWFCVPETKGRTISDINRSFT